MLAQGEERGTFGLLLGREFLHLDRRPSEEDRVGLLAELEVRRGAPCRGGRAGAADVGDRVLEGEVLLPGDVIEYAQRLGHDLGPM